MQTQSSYLTILESKFLIQSKVVLNNTLLFQICSIIQKPINPPTNPPTNPQSIATSEWDSGFYAPYTNYYTTFSTTVISLLERLKISLLGDIIRLEEIYTIPQDPLVYKYYTNLQNYREYIIESRANIINELVYFQAIRGNQPHLLDAINNISPILSLEHQSKYHLDTSSYIQLRFRNINSHLFHQMPQHW